MTALLPDVLRHRAQTGPARRAYVFLDDSGEEKTELTYGELHHRALAVAERLLADAAPGDRALLSFPPGLDFIVAYFGCLYAGIIAVPVHPPRRGQDAIHTILRDCAPTTVLTLGSTQDYPSLEPLAVDELPTEPSDGFEPRPCAPEQIAFLQYTSGSTAAPKGVLVTHGNLAANQEMIRAAFGHDAESTVVGWAPLFHDQGLIGNVLQPLWVGASAVLMSPTTFIRRPMTWLSAISRYRAHTSGGPNFAFDACVSWADRRGVPDLDLSSWKVAFNGAEPIRADTVRRFAETFAPSGFAATAMYPCYGLAEATLLVTGSRKGRGPVTVEADAEQLGHGRYAPGDKPFVGSGTVDGSGVRIVGPDSRQPREPGAVGEIWITGQHVAQGYWQRPEVTADIFHNEIDGERYLRTGDLGLVLDGELYVVGRRKDLVIIRGRNYYPQDVEHTVGQAHPALGTSAAFGAPGEDGERLVVVTEIRREHRRDGDPKAIVTAVRAAVTREHGVSLGDLVVTQPGQLEKTSSGKIRRAAARGRYLEGGFPAWTPVLEAR